MKLRIFKIHLAALISGAVLSIAPGIAAGQSARDGIEALRNDLRADRTSLVAEQMKFTDQEAEVFWPIYRSYRADVDKVADEMVKMILQYADLYPNVPDKEARELLDHYLKAEEKLLSIRRRYLGKLEKALPAAKVFRFAQLDNRLDLGVRVALAASIPVLSGNQPQPAPEK